MQRRISTLVLLSSVFLALAVLSAAALIPGAVPSAFVGVCHTGWRREFPCGLALMLAWCYPLKAQGRKSDKVVLLCRPGLKKSAPQKLPIKPASGIFVCA